MWQSFPLFGSSLLLAVMLAAAYTFAVAVGAHQKGTVRALQSARFGAYGTVALIAVAVVCLAYAFVSHDFRLRYVAHYSDRGMPTIFLFTALWGGQDGSLLWWLFLLSLYIGACLFSMGKKHLELQPTIIATLMGVVIFFCVLMAFAANPFSTSVAGARNDGEGLNPLLQNFYMIIHPPSLYVGFVGCTIPFAFAVAALVTGRLSDEWIKASRKFTLFAWLFLGIGNTLGMLWAYEELGWGGYWAWDPVENAAFMPFLVISAFVHSVMIQERRGMLKVWNVFLICFTFFMTIFGTFLTRSGSIASVHSFAQSSIGIYFVYFLVLVAAFCFTLILYRWPELRDLPPTPALRKAAILTGWSMLVLLTVSYLVATKVGGPALPTDAASTLGPEGMASYNLKRTLIKVVVFSLLAGGAVYAALELVFRRMTTHLKLVSTLPRFESIWSREFTFMLNNWGLLSFMLFVLAATTFPMVSEALWNEKVTVGPPYYNAWVQPIGLVIFFLMGVGTLFGWKKTSPELLKKNFLRPTAITVVFAVLHLAFGKALGYPAIVWSEAIYGGALGQALRGFNAVTPLIGIGLSVFNAAVIVQEFVFLYAARAKTKADDTPKILYYLGLLPGFVYSMVTLPPTSRRRYGGYIVHMGIVLMFIGFTGKSWTVDQEASLGPGQSLEVGRLKLEYKGPRMEVDTEKRMVFADIRVTEGGKDRGMLTPAKFIYKKMPESPTTEVAMLHSIRDDLYVVVGTINPQTKLASLQVHINPLVGWIWLGALVLIFGSIVCMWPEFQEEESRVWRVTRGAAAITASILMGVLIALMPTQAFAQGTSSSLHSGTVKIENPKEKEIFSALRCMCGTCARDLLSTCACGEAEETRERLREKIASGLTKDQIVAEYSAQYGTASLAIPPNTGAMQSIYVVPLTVIAGGAVGLGMALKKWRGQASEPKAKPGKAKKATREDTYDARLDAELKDLDDA